MTKHGLRVLLIAPKSMPHGVQSLPWVDEEIQSIVNSGLFVRLERNIDERLLLEVLASQPKAFDIVWFATHGTEQGVLLSGGIVSVEAIVSILRNSGVRHVVLNTCDSVHMAAAISEETGADVICTITQIEDRQAWRTAALLANNLAAGMSVLNAFRKSRPSQAGKYIYLPSISDPDNRTAIIAKIDELTQALASGQPERVDTIINDMASLSVRVSRIEGRVTVLERKMSPPLSAILLFAAALGLVIINAVVIVLAVGTPGLAEVLGITPLVPIITEFAFVLLVATWLRAAILILRAHARKQDDSTTS